MDKMYINKTREVLDNRDYLVVKGNDLIQRSRFELSLVEQKAIAYICSLIKPTVASTKTKGVPFILEYDFKILDYCKVCGINYDGGKTYKEIKSTFKRLSDRSMWLERGDEEILVRWLSRVSTNKRSGIIKIFFDEYLIDYLFELHEKFTQYHLQNILAMRSAFSVRIYELMQSYAFQKSKTFDLEELKKRLMVDEIKSYKTFPDFRRKVLEMAIKEINELTDLNVKFDPIKNGRKVVKIEFIINKKDAMERFATSLLVNEKLEKKTYTI